MTKDELKKRLTETIGLLNIPGVGRGRYHRLVRAFGSPSKVLAASVNELETVSGISHSIAADIKTKHDADRARQITARIIQLGWTVLFPDQSEFPAPLLNIPEGDVSPVLFCDGENISPGEKMIAIVGTRHPTEDGRLFTFNLAKSLAQAGVTIVSGMAEGIDSAAHKGAIEAGGRTVAVWGNSLDIVYPTSNKGLAAEIKKTGVVYSEYNPDTGPNRAHFPERNRIISGLTDGVVVIQAGRKSGALITASNAIEQGREIFAVPGQPGARNSEGTNALIKKGARLLTSIDDIFEELPRLKGEVLTRKFCQLPDMTDTEKRIISLFSSGPRQVDQISRAVDMPVPELMEFLLALELKGVVRELSGKRFVLSEEYA